MRSVPLCRKCGTSHWNMKPCPQTDVASPARPVQVFRRADTTTRGHGDQLRPGTVRLGESTFARIRPAGVRLGEFTEGEAA